MSDLNLLRKQAEHEHSSAASTKPTWDLGDYTGNYHYRRIKKTHAIPGTQLARESARSFEAKERWRRAERLVEAQQARSKHALRQAESIRCDLEKIRSTYGWQANAGISDTLVKEIDIATDKFAARTEPDVAKAWERKYTSAQRRLLTAIKTNDYRDAHTMFLAAESGAGEAPDCNFSIGPHNTPLILAIRQGDVKMSRIILKQGNADPNYPNSMGLPGMFYVFEEWRNQILYKVPGRSSLLKMLDRSVDLIQLLGGAGGNVNAVGLGGETPVHMAAGLGHARHLFLLCKFGFDPTLRNNVGKLALDVARDQGKTECVIILTEWPKIRRTVELELFRDAWKPFLASNANAVPRSMHIGKTAEETLHELMLKERVRRNEIMERTLQFGTSVKFVYDNDEILAKIGGDEDDGAFKTEVVMQAMRNALNTRGKDVRALTEKEIADEKQRIAKEQSLKFRKGGLNRRDRKKLKNDRAKVSEEKRKLLNPLQRRRIHLAKRFMNGFKDPSPQKIKGRSESSFERMLRSRDSSSSGVDDGGEFSSQSSSTPTKKTDPLRPATASAVFHPKRLSPAKMTRGSRASLLPLGLTRLGSRKMLSNSAILLPSEKLALQEKKSAEQILEEKLEKMLKGDDESKEGDAAVAAVVPANLLPPPLTEEEEKELMLMNLGTHEEELEDREENGDDGGDGGNKKKEKRKLTDEQMTYAATIAMAEKKHNQRKNRTMRTLHVGFSPGFKPMTDPWSQTVFSLELPQVKGAKGNGAYQI